MTRKRGAIPKRRASTANKGSADEKLEAYMELSSANDLLNPGYLPFESGYWDIADGKRLVAALTWTTRSRAQMVHWWFSWLGGTEQYKLWHPRDHVFSDWEDRHDG